ncbi:serine/threonine-protein kinase fused isoform X2 [Trichogramma pretiosum]|nr:serine/threonine-protein kinase fused isoform X2 [Trichogramma pretiosum]
MHHPNIIQMFDSFETDKQMVIVTEYVERELYVILKTNGRLSEVYSQAIAGDMVSALNYLHSNRIVHRDMKPQNVLMSIDGVAKLCDFGFARMMNVDTHVLTSVKGTPLYMAPELIDELPYDHTVDIWSLGCIVYELVCGAPPFQTTSMRKLVHLIKHEDIKWPENVSPQCRSFLQGLLRKNPMERFSWPQLLSHSFVKNWIFSATSHYTPESPTMPLPTTSSAKSKPQNVQNSLVRSNNQTNFEPSYLRKMLEKQIKKLQSQVLRRSETNSGSEAENIANCDQVLQNLSIRISRHLSSLPQNQSDQRDEHIMLPISKGKLHQQQQQQQQHDANCMDGAVASSIGPQLAKDRSLDAPPQNNTRDLAERLARLGADWAPRDIVQPIENQEWAVFLQKTMEEVMEGEITSLIQENCMSVFVAPLRNPLASCCVLEYVACLAALAFVAEGVSEDDLETILQVYLDTKLVPNLLYATKLLMTEKYPESDASTSTCNNKWRSNLSLSNEELQALESAMLVVCRLAHIKDNKQAFLRQFCDAVWVVQDATELLQQLLGLEKRKPRVVADLLAVMNEILRSDTGNSALLDILILGNRSTDDTISLFTKLLMHRQVKLRTRACIFLSLLGKSNRTTLQRIWGNGLRGAMQDLLHDPDDSAREAANEAIASLKNLPFYHQEKDTWSVIES